MTRTNLILLGAAIAMLFSSGLHAQYPDTLWVPVTFYDYHADGTNPNFEPPTYDESFAGVKPGMVQGYLDVDNKPILLQNLAFNDRLNTWFRPNGGTFGTYAYDSTLEYWTWSGLEPYLGRANEYVATNFLAFDPMANVIIYDSLPFILIDSINGTYEFVDSAFHPLDGRGFGAEPAAYPPYGWTNTANNNFSFSMEFHLEFTYDTGLVFNFIGDDDVWAFIDGGLVMDLGGIHGWAPGTFNLDALGLTIGDEYSFDFFYCERHVTGSHIRVTTNIIRRVLVERVDLEANPPGGIVASGDSIIFTADVWLTDPETGLMHSVAAYNDRVTW